MNKSNVRAPTLLSRKRDKYFAPKIGRYFVTTVTMASIGDRLQEKEELKCLGDRLVSYTYRVRQLQEQNPEVNALVSTVHTLENELLNTRITLQGHLHEEERKCESYLVEKEELRVALDQKLVENDKLQQR